MKGNVASGTKIEFANTLRGFAALVVVFSHYCSTFWYKRDAVANLIHAPVLAMDNSAPLYVMWLNQFPLFDWGSYGVGLFFLISGFVIPFSLGKTNRLAFLVSRFLRVVPTYIMGFSITLLALYLGSQYFLTPWFYSFQEIMIHYLPGVRDILDSKNIDSIIWTLEIEIKFYLIMTLLQSWSNKYSLKIFLIPIIFFLLNCFMSSMIPIWATSNFTALIWSRIFILSSQYLIFMFLGVAFHYLYCQRLDFNQGYFLIGFLFFLFCISWWVGPYSESIILAWSYALALLTFMFAYAFPGFFKTNRFFKFLADISYPLYVIHCIAGYVLLRILIDNGLDVGMTLLIVSMVMLILSWALHVFIEQPSQKLGRRLAAQLHLKHSSIFRVNSFKIKQSQ